MTTARLIKMIEVTNKHGSGSFHDPVRELKDYFYEDGTPVVSDNSDELKTLRREHEDISTQLSCRILEVERLDKSLANAQQDVIAARAEIERLDAELKKAKSADIASCDQIDALRYSLAHMEPGEFKTVKMEHMSTMHLCSLCGSSSFSKMNPVSGSMVVCCSNNVCPDSKYYITCGEWDRIHSPSRVSIITLNHRDIIETTDKIIREKKSRKSKTTRPRKGKNDRHIRKPATKRRR